MKNYNKGLWVVVLSLGVLVTPGLTLSLKDSTNIKGSEEPNNIKEEPNDKKDEPNNKKEEPNKDKKKTIDAICDINPHKLNMKSKGKFITVFIEIVNKYDANDIILEEILLNDFLNCEAKPFNIGDHNDNDIPDLMIKFDRAAVISFLISAEPLQFWEVKITGKLFDGVKFEATSMVELLNF